ncbi:MAG TPA: glycosyl hydrolase [Opitutus sp.]|nr:glycosyl hydrolase [Opitutus sp.]
MKSPLAVLRLFALLALAPAALHAADAVAPVTPDASPEARALLQLLHDISGRSTFTGQHNYPNVHGRNSVFAARTIGKTPVIWGTDLGFAKDGDTDSYLGRPDIVQEAIAQHRRGAIVALCWHAVPPTADEPVTFRPLPGADPDRLASVQGQLTDAQFQAVLTPGTDLYNHWCEQVDRIAGFLQQLQNAHVPVLWRPYHEMNGTWFWWGGRTEGKYTTAALYCQMFDRLVNHHQLRNLVWVWSVDRVHGPAMAHAKYFPGLDRVDVLALDVYGNDFAPAYYDSLVELAHGKPLALAEVGNPPSPEVLAQQPRWTYYMTWAGMVRNTTPEAYAALLGDPRILNLDDARYADVTAAYRAACGLPRVDPAPLPPDFSGLWVLNEAASQLGRFGAAGAPAHLEISDHGDALTIRSVRVVEYADNQVAEETVRLDGSESKSEFMNAPRVTTAHRSADGGTITMESTIHFPWGPPGSTATETSTWSLRDGGRVLAIERTAVSPAGRQETTQLFDKR